MSSIKRIRKRKLRKVYGYLFISSGLFCLVLALCMSVFYITHPKARLISPLSAVNTMVFGTSDNQFIMQVQQLCQTYNLACNNFTSSNDDTISFEVEDHKIVLSTKKSISQEMASLQLTIRQLTMEGKEFRGLDFRYDRPVISY